MLAIFSEGETGASKVFDGRTCACPRTRAGFLRKKLLPTGHQANTGGILWNLLITCITSLVCVNLRWNPYKLTTIL